MKILSFLLLCVLLFTATTCDKEDDAKLISECQESIVIDQNFVPGNVPAEDYNLAALSVDGLCLTITVGKSGCSTDGWQMELVTRGEVAESLPTQTSAFVLFDDGVADSLFVCQAYLTKEFSFDLSPYLEEGALPTVLTLEPLGTSVRIN